MFGLVFSISFTFISAIQEDHNGRHSLFIDKLVSFLIAFHRITSEIFGNRTTFGLNHRNQKASKRKEKKLLLSTYVYLNFLVILFFWCSVDLRSLVEQNKPNFIPPASRMTNYVLLKFGNLSETNVSLHFWFVCHEFAHLLHLIRNFLFLLIKLIVSLRTALCLRVWVIP